MSKKNQLPEEPGKMTVYEYEQKYSKKENVRGAKLMLKLIAIAIGVVVATCLVTITLKLWDVHMYAGIAAAAVSVILFICLYIVPLVKIIKTGKFQVNVNAKTARQAQKHNKKLRREIANKIIELTAQVDGVGWYDSQIVGELAIAVNTNNNEGIKKSLTALYSGSVKKAAKSLIYKSAVKSGMYSALAQTSRADALLVVFLNLQLIKDIVFLYGFRPSDAKLVRIFGRVLQNSLIAYGLGNIKIGNSIVKTMGDAMKGLPLLGAAISTIVDSSVQGLTNGVLTTVMGYQTIKYLSYEYKLQNILDGVEIVAEDEMTETCQEIEKELKGKHSKQAKPAKTVKPAKPADPEKQPA